MVKRLNCIQIVQQMDGWEIRVENVPYLRFFFKRFVILCELLTNFGGIDFQLILIELDLILKR